jgi:formylglycine-generating enzyme required for sulfatase activity
MLALCLLGCDGPARPAGYVSVRIDTNVAVPRLVDRIRIDVFTEDGRWLSSTDRAVSTPLRLGDRARDATPLPIDFALVPRDVATRALVRVRGYREGHVRDYPPPPVDPPVRVGVSQFEGTCRGATILKIGQPATVRASAEEPARRALSCGAATAATTMGVAVVDVPTPGKYRLVLDDLTPGQRWRRYLAPVAFVVPGCDAEAVVQACATDDPGSPDPFLSLTVPLAAGQYRVMIGNQRPASLEARILLVPAEPTSAGGASAATLPPEPPSRAPRLIIDGQDHTPPQEPEPRLAIDRLALIDVDPSVDRRVSILLSGDCLSVEADLIGHHSCLGLSRPYGTVEVEPALPRRAPARAERAGSRAGSWFPGQTQPCQGPVPDPLAGERPICVPGGVFTLGDPTVLATGADAAVPQRIAMISPFFMDRTEVTVGRYRALRASGADVGPPPHNNFRRLDFLLDGVDGDYCTYNDSNGQPLFPEREQLPLTCVPADLASKICEASGGRLPTAAEWELAATAAGRSIQTHYPWGNGAPRCDQAIFARWAEPQHGHDDCAPDFGPASVDDTRADINALGIDGLGGNVSEWTSDSHRSYAGACWNQVGMADPTCQEAGAPLHTVKGGSWRQDAAFTRAAVRLGVPPSALDDAIGFRCVYPARREAR